MKFLKISMVAVAAYLFYLTIAWDKEAIKAFVSGATLACQIFVLFYRK